jgi:uncharacterized membrane protein
MIETQSAASHGLGTGRVMALTDGVFAIVLTLFVLDLRPPAARTNAQLLSELRALIPALAAFVVSFAVVSVFWYGHHMESHWIRRSDRIHLGITLILLLTICFVPFSAALLGRNQQIPLAATVYGANLCLAGTARYLHWTYATHGRRLVDENMDSQLIAHVRRIFLLVVFLYLLAIALAWLSTTIAVVCFALIPVLYIVPSRRTRHLTSLKPQSALSG